MYRVILLIGIYALFAGSRASAEAPMKVFILVGQSNMQGHAHVRTLAHLQMDDASKELLAKIQNSDETYREYDDIRISYLSAGGVKEGKLTVGFGANDEKIGPELTFGIVAQEQIGEPILIIKAAWGGKSINTDFRPPSAGPYVFHPDSLERMEKQGKDIDEVKRKRDEATGVYYRQTIEHVKDVLRRIESVHPAYSPEDGYELAGLVWFQGWNDMVDSTTYPNRGEAGGYDDYSKVLEHLIRDFRRDLNAPELPFVIGVMGVNGPTEDYGPSQQRYLKVHQGFRDAMAAPAKSPEFSGNVHAVLTEEAWDAELNDIVDRDNKLKGKARQLSKNYDAKQLETEEGLGRELSEAEQESLSQLKGNALQQKILELLRAGEFTSGELQILEVGPSNAAYHYLGSAKIMTRIGKAFAEALR